MNCGLPHMPGAVGGRRSGPLHWAAGRRTREDKCVLWLFEAWVLPSYQVCVFGQIS